MSSLVKQAAACASSSPLVFAKFLSANETGETKSHQCGVYIPKNSVSLIFDAPFSRGENHKREASITWNGDLVTKSLFKYYGIGTRDEYRITHFGRGFPFLKPSHTGDLLVICKRGDADYAAFVLGTELEIESFLDAFSLAPTQLNSLVKGGGFASAQAEDEVLESTLVDFEGEFPDTKTMALSAREAERVLRGEEVILTRDDEIVRWIDIEYKLFRRIETSYYAFVLERPATSLDEFVKTGLEIANRRKSRAGKSLELHLKAIFEEEGLRFSYQMRTEGKRKPDFIFPSDTAYRDSDFPADKLMFLGAKTTCKDRWRQILNEANRISCKYLFTLQQGVSRDQLEEMHEEGVVLVVPQAYHFAFPKTPFEALISLEEFIARVKENQACI